MRVGFSYDESIGEYVVEKILSTDGTQSILDNNTCEYYLVAGTDNSYASVLNNFIVGDVIHFDTNLATLASSDININASLYHEFDLIYEAYGLKATGITLPVLEKDNYKFDGWFDE